MSRKQSNNRREKTPRAGGIQTMEAFAEFMKAMYTASHPEHGAKIVGDGTTTALAILDGKCISPMACLDGFYQKYRNRELSLWEIWGSIAESLDGFSARRDRLATSVLDFNQIKDRICYKLVNREKNRELLENSPHIPWLDLEIIFYIPVAVGGGNGLSLPVDNTLMEQWGITDVNQIYAAAHANTQKIFPGSIRDMEEVFDTFKDSKNPGEIKQARIFMEEDLEANRRGSMYIVTNSEMLNGACAVLYDNLLKEFADRLGNDLYIMASSVHEILIVSAESTDPDELRAIVEDVNREDAPKEEFLSDNIYRYDRAAERVEIL